MKSVKETFMYYKNMEKTVPNSGMLREVEQQYAEMARGGDGGPLGFTPADYLGSDPGPDGPSCRDYNYPGYPDSFFQEICALMNWRY